MVIVKQGNVTVCDLCGKRVRFAQTDDGRAQMRKYIKRHEKGCRG